MGGSKNLLCCILMSYSNYSYLVDRPKFISVFNKGCVRAAAKIISYTRNLYTSPTPTQPLKQQLYWCRHKSVPAISCIKEQQYTNCCYWRFYKKSFPSAIVHQTVFLKANRSVMKVFVPPINCPGDKKLLWNFVVG